MTDDYAFIYVHALAAVIVPRRAFEAGRDFERFVATARRLHQGASERASSA